MKIKKILKRNDKIKKEILLLQETINKLLKEKNKLLKEMIDPCHMCIKEHSSSCNKCYDYNNFVENK